MTTGEIQNLIDTSVQRALSNTRPAYQVRDGVDTPKIDPLDLLGFPVLTFATTTLRDAYFTSAQGLRQQQGVFKIAVENATPSYRLYYFIVDVANPAGKWHFTALT